MRVSGRRASLPVGAQSAKKKRGEKGSQEDGETAGRSQFFARPLANLSFLSSLSLSLRVNALLSNCAFSSAGLACQTTQEREKYNNLLRLGSPS